MIFHWSSFPFKSLAFIDSGAKEKWVILWQFKKLFSIGSSCQIKKCVCQPSSDTKCVQGWCNNGSRCVPGFDSLACTCYFVYVIKGPVWPDIGIKGSLKIIKSCPKVATSGFTQKCGFFKVAQNVTKYLGSFCKNNLTPRTFKNRPIWSHWIWPALVIFLSLWQYFCRVHLVLGQIFNLL